MRSRLLTTMIALLPALAVSGEPTTGPAERPESRAPAAAQPQEPSAGSTGSAADDGAFNAAAKGGEEGSTGVFLPSEEISEDFAVSFPVDI